MRLFAFFAFVLLVSSSAWAQTTDINVMQQCQSFDQCTIVWGGCSDVAINKAYLQQFKPSVTCLATAPHDPKAVPTCENNICVVVSPVKKDGTVN